MPTILLAFGLRFYFYSDEHLPIHVHVENAEGRAKFSLEPNIELIKNEGMKPKDLKKSQDSMRDLSRGFYREMA